MKKVLLSSAVVAAMGASGLANAVVDLDNNGTVTANGSLTYASELAILSTGSNLADNTNNQNLRAELGFGVSAGATRFIRVDLGAGAEFQNDPGLAVTETGEFIATDAGDAGPADDTKSVDAGQITLVSGGAGESFAIFQFTANGPIADGDPTTDSSVGVADISLSQNAVVVIDVDGVTVSGKNDVAATYTLYETGTDAQNEGAFLATASQVAYRFGSALEITAGPSTGTEAIDVAQASLYFDDGATDDIETPFGVAEIALVNPAPLLVNGSPVATLLANGSPVATLSDIINPAGVTAVVSGDFSSASGLTNDGVTGNLVDPATIINADGDAVFDVENVSLAPGAAPLPASRFTGTGVSYVFLYETDGETVIPETTFALTLGLAAQTGYTLPATIGPINLSSFEKNGSSAFTNLNLDPNGAFQNFIRITNPTGVDGGVFLTVINDAGASVELALDDITVANVALPAVLDAGASTRLIPVTAVIAAAQAADSSFDVAEASANKFRIVANGEFGSGNNGIRIDNVTLANDNTTFSTF